MQTERITEMTGHKFKKGDTVYLVHVYDRDDSRENPVPGRALVCAQLVTLQSYGKQQGHCTYVENGRLLKKRIYPSDLLLATREDVVDLARTEGMASSVRAIPRQLESERQWLSEFELKARRDVVENVRRKIAVLTAAKPSVRIWFHDGVTQENVVLESEQR